MSTEINDLEVSMEQTINSDIDDGLGSPTLSSSEESQRLEQDNTLDIESDGQIEHEKQPYTAEEMRNLDWQSIDTSRIPDEMQAFYKSMQASYTRKRQAEVEQIKSLTAEQAPLSLQNIPILNVEKLQQAKELAVSYINRTSPLITPEHPSYDGMVTNVANKIIADQQRKATQMSYINTEKESAKSMYGSDYQKVDKLAQQILMQEYPASVLNDIKKATSGGNFAPIRELHRIAHERIIAEKQIATKKIEPPVAIGAGSKGSKGRDSTAILFGY